MEHGKILKFKQNSNSLFRLKRRNFNPFPSLFFVSLSFNILFLFIFLIK